jgi:UDP:flavonoid glycosyltransferase YjiC (YdhE family)
MNKTFLLVPGNNSLSHVAKCLAVREALNLRGHKVHIAVSKRSSRFLKKIQIDHYVLPDIQESDGSMLPTVEWFRHQRNIIDCIKAEVEMLRQLRPDRVLGIFRFTLKASAKLTGIPYDSLTCGCMTPDSQEVLGFAGGEPGMEQQRTILEGFYRYAGAKLSDAYESFSVNGVSHVLSALKGEQTFLWDFPEFMQLPPGNNYIYTGPFSWNRWPYDNINIDSIADGSRLAIVAFGTCVSQAGTAMRLVPLLLELGYKVLIAAGGQKNVLEDMPRSPRVITLTYAPLHKLFPQASLVVSHGGQMTVFEALQNRIPAIIMPFQPEQAHNGVCLERLGCGSRLVPSRPFQGNPAVYINALKFMTDEEIKTKICGLVDNPQTAKRLEDNKCVMGRYEGIEKMVTMMEKA